MGRLRLHERDAVRALWRGHFEAWRLSGLTQREYCERHGLSLKSFGNWRGQLKREDVAGRDARWGRHPRLRHMVSPMATPMASEAADRVPAVVTRTGRRRQFSEEDKRLIVEETCRPGQSLPASLISEMYSNEWLTAILRAGSMSFCRGTGSQRGRSTR